MAGPRPQLLYALLLGTACALLGGCPTSRDAPAQTASAGAGSTAPAPEPKASVAAGAPNALIFRPGTAVPAATAPTPDDHGDDSLAATLVTFGESVSGCLATPTDRDWFAVDLPAGQPCTFGFSCFGMARLVLVDGDGVTELQAGPPGTASLDHTVATGGRVYLRVETEAGRDLYYDLDVR